MRKCATRILFVFLTAGAFMLTGCGKDGSASNLSSTSPTSPTPGSSNNANTCSAPSTSVLWKGERAAAGTVAIRGAWSDIKVIPSTTYPASAYVDAGCLCVRYTFWDGTDWKTEIIAAGNSTSYTFIRLAFLSSGIPIVVWSNSTTTLQMAIRSTSSLTDSATWTLTNLDTGGIANRSIEINVNPLDQVAILYARNTAGTANLIICSTNCNSGANYSAPSTTLGTVGTNPNSLGLGWCKAGASTYYPTVALTGATNSSYAICRQANLANCLTGIASWAGGALQALTGSGANRASVQLAIDSSTIDAPVRAALTNGTNITYYQSSFAGGGCASGTVAAMTSSGAIAGTTATSGNAYLVLQRDSGGNYHIAANEGTTNIKYYNTITGSFTAWNASGNVATATLAAAGATRGGFAVDASLAQAYTTYARTAAASPFPGNLTFGWVENTAIASNNASSAFYETPLTVDGQLQMTANQVPNVSIASTSEGTPASAFVDYSTNSATAGILRYAYRIGSLATSNWSVRAVPIVAQPQAVALAFDTSNKPWIAFYDQQTLRFFLVTNTETDGSGVWSTYHFPFATAVTAAVAPAYHSVALAMDKSASGITPVLVVGVANHGTLSKTGVWASRLNPTTGAWSSTTQIVSTNLANSISNVSTDYDSNGNIVVAYYNRSASNRVEYAQSVNGGITWSTPTRVSSFTASGMGAKVKLNPATNRPAITFYDRANNRIFYSYCTSAFASCSTLSSWSYSYVENLTAGVSGLAAASDGLLSAALTFTSTGDAYVVYPIGSGNSGVLAVNNNSTGSFPLSTALVAGNNTDLISNTTLSAINFAQPGWDVDAVRTSQGSLHSVYVGPGNWLYVTSCGD
ncbi:MAG: exo-alpha-sialidase [Bdellovibrionaceae bacterium]|nr:exo-alpha-sialidase [Pseudobdellovibrionaceae bacterium]